MEHSENAKKGKGSTLLCALCHRALHMSCMQCRCGRRTGPCYVLMDKKKGFRHRHCAIIYEGWKST